MAGYLSESSTLNQIGAAQRMNCLNPISFRLFFNRVRNRIHPWIALLLQLLHTLGGKVKGVAVGENQSEDTESLQSQWSWFLQLAKECVHLYGRISDTKVIVQQFQWQYIYSLLARQKMGLGP